MDNNLQSLVLGFELNTTQKALAKSEYEKLKREHAEMVEFISSYYRYLNINDQDKAEQLLNKIKENGN
jgi:sulfur relay (sulfurtransferase) DsrC/TusE family protein